MDDNIYRRVVISVLLFFGISGAFIYSAAGGDTEPSAPVVHDGARMVTLEGFIMYIDLNERIIVMKEKLIVAGRYLKDGRELSTQMKSASGVAVGIESFETGQWVAITGYEVSKARLHAVSVRAVKGSIGKNRRRIDKLRRPR